MTQFIVYDDQGFILRSGNCADSDINLQAGDGELVMEGIANNSSQMVVAGVVCNKPEPVNLTDEELIRLLKPEVRFKRNQKLAVSDWTQFPDSPLSDTQKSAWATYRQTLRDIPANNADVTSIDDITWPTPP